MASYRATKEALLQETYKDEAKKNGKPFAKLSDMMFFHVAAPVFVFFFSSYFIRFRFMYLVPASARAAAALDAANRVVQREFSI